MTPLSKLMWFARHDPATWMAARWWVGLKDWILLWLTGRVVTELSSASGTGLLDMSTAGLRAQEAIELSAVNRRGCRRFYPLPPRSNSPRRRLRRSACRLVRLSWLARVTDR